MTEWTIYSQTYIYIYGTEGNLKMYPYSEVVLYIQVQIKTNYSLNKDNDLLSTVAL